MPKYFDFNIKAEGVTSSVKNVEKINPNTKASLFAFEFYYKKEKIISNLGELKNPSFKSIFYNDFFQQFLNKDWTSNQPNKICSTKCGRKVKSNDWKTKVNKNYEIINS